MYDRFNRKISYLRISVTDRCNLRCRYCMPANGVKMLTHEEILSFEEIVKVVTSGVQNGISKVRLTGGEPLVRKGIVDLVRMLASIKGIEELTMTTNGILLDKFALPLKKEGLNRVNISLDTVDADKYARITRGGDIQQVLRGIDAALEAELSPVKLNCVIMKSVDEPDAVDVKNFARQKGLSVRFIHQMDLENGSFSLVEGGKGGDCKNCNRLRITASGDVKPCLFNDMAYNVKQYGIEESYRLALENKPLSGSKNKSGKFYNIGG